MKSKKAVVYTFLIKSTQHFWLGSPLLVSEKFNFFKEWLGVKNAYGSPAHRERFNSAERTFGIPKWDETRLMSTKILYPLLRLFYEFKFVYEFKFLFCVIQLFSVMVYNSVLVGNSPYNG